ncbi:proprotein convertase P-domain-containing protein [uncultured Lutibacter sp.]|uniref:proprotein convertase P-domain-containing protein n=1 Tax=uncultured Lutibacter sp. TaxID=437739 RepID=UPI00262F29AD|nr:proprotein convertase P-domain-containing protein [uncultured Lutibacter sp.]
MKKRLPPFLLLISLAVLTFFLFKSSFKNNLEQVDSVSLIRSKHADFLKNSPFKKTLKLSKSQRKAIQLPPNKYYEREWELTMNPFTGKPEPEKIYQIQKNRNKKNKSYSGKYPGDEASNSWVERGPNNVGGRTRVVLFDPNDATNKRVFAGGVSGGLWVNNDITNSNSSWTLVSGVPSNMNISCITVDPNNPLIWYIGTGEQYTFGAAVGNGVYKTTNGGTNWSHVPINVVGGGSSTDLEGAYYINDILAYYNGTSTDVFIGVGSHVYGDAASPTNWLGFYNSGLYKSSNGGTSWNRIEPPNMPKGTYNYIPNDLELDSNNNIWMGTIRKPGTSEGGGKIFKSINGISWTEITTLPNSNRVELAVTSSLNKIYALTQGTDGEPHIFLTTNGFNNYTELTKPDDADTGIPANDFTRNQDFYNLVIEVDPNNDAIVYVGGIDLFRSTNSGSSWSQISKWSNNNNLASLNCSLVHADQHAFTFRPGNSNEAVIGCDGGVYYANSLSTASSSDVFTVMNTNYNVTQFYYGGYGPSSSTELIIAGAQDNGSQFMENATAGINSSIEVYGGDGAFSEIDKDGDYMIVSYVYNDHYYFDLTGSGTNYSIDNGDSDGDFINQAALDPSLDIMYSNGTNGSNSINRYSLGSNSAIKTKLTNSLLSSSPTAFKVSPYTTDKTVLLVGLQNGSLLKVSNANSVNTSQICWEDITGSSFVGSISDIEFGATENDIFVTFHNYGVSNIWYSSNGGKSWIDKEGNLFDMPVKSILQNPLAKNEVIIGTELGVWASKNFNEANPTWTSSFNGMRDVKVVDLDLRTSDNSILATTFGRGCFTGQFNSSTEATYTISTQNSVINSCTSATSEVFNFEYTPLGGYSTNTSISVNGIPAGASYTLSSSTFSNSSASINLTINDISSVAKGEYVITITGVGGSTVSTDILLIVRDDVSDITTISPIDGSNQIDINNASLVWNGNSEATLYDVEIATDAAFNSIIESEATCNTQYDISTVLNLNTVYYWRVRPKNDCNIGNFTETQNFITSPAPLCNTFNSVGVNNNITISSNSSITSKINIPNSSSVFISDINVTINLNHTWVQDLTITLTSPDGISILLFENNCGDEDNLAITYDDEASNYIICGSSPVSGTFKPVNSLTGFYNNNEESKGNWQLEIHDGYSGDDGELLNWSLEICESTTSTNSTFTNNPFTVEVFSSYVLNQTETEASSSGSLPNEQVFTINKQPSLGNITLNDIIVELGDVFTQEDINTGIVKYVNSSALDNTDSFIVDITNATNGFLPNQEVNITLDATSLSVDDQFFEKTGTTVYPTISTGDFSIASNTTLGNTTIEIYSLNGQKVFSQQLIIYKGNISKISTYGLATGIYVLKLNTEKTQGSKKIIIK